MCPRPATYRVLAWLARTLGARSFERLVAGPLAFDLKHWSRPAVERTLVRILRFRGEQPSGERVDALLDSMAGLYADDVTTMHLLAPETAGHWRDRIDLKALPAIQAIREQGRGVILATPHFGNISLTVIALGQCGLPVTVLAVSAEAFRWVEDYGPRFVSLGHGAKRCLSALRRGEVVLILADLDFFPKEPPMELFGAPMRGPIGPARLSLATGAPILPVYAVRREGLHALEADEAIWPVEGATPQTLAWELLRSMERWIGEHPDHWLIFRDVWNLEASDRLNRMRFRLLEAYRRLRRAFDPTFEP